MIIYSVNINVLEVISEVKECVLLADHTSHLPRKGADLSHVENYTINESVICSHCGNEDPINLPQ